MGNCQAAEAATVVIQHPGNKVQRIYWSVSANEVMASNPGHYVALVINSPTARTENGLPMKQLKLLRPDDSLLMGQVYRLVSFEDVLKEFAAKKSVKLGKLLRESGGLVLDSSKKNPNPPRLAPPSASLVKGAHEFNRTTGIGGGRGVGGRQQHQHQVVGGGQWKPALQSIAEIGT